MNEKTKASMLKYRKSAREQIQVDMAKGMKAKIKAYADKRGMSMSALILMLLENEMQYDGFNAEWDRMNHTDSAQTEPDISEHIASIRSELKPPERK